MSQSICALQSIETPSKLKLLGSCRYLVELLRAYAKLQTFKPQVHSNAVHIRFSAMGPDATNRIGTRDCSFCTNPPSAG